MDLQTIERLSAQRDDIYDWVVDKFREFMAEERVDDAMALADEFFEWMDPDQMDAEETLYSDYDELRS
jgi:hypothetical protein